MASKREQVLAQLLTQLKTIESATLKIYRNMDKPQTIQSGGLVIMRDGDSPEPEVLLSPLTYIYEHYVSLDVMVQDAVVASRDSKMDTLLVNIGTVLIANRTLGGLAEWVEPSAADIIEDPVEGAGTIRTASVRVMVRYATTNPLN